MGRPAGTLYDAGIRRHRERQSHRLAVRSASMTDPASPAVDHERARAPTPRPGTRSWRVKRVAGEKVSWANLHDQFGHEYDDVKNFKKRFVIALRTACAVYTDARVELAPG